MQNTFYNYSVVLIFKDLPVIISLPRLFLSTAIFCSRYNKSLPADRCPEMEVSSLRRMIMSDEAQGHSNPSVSSTHFSPRVAQVMRSDFNILKIMMVPTNLCQGEFTFVHPPPPPESPPDDDLSIFGSNKSSDEYLITFIVPAVVIASMVLLALLVACALYRRRRRGKLAVGERGPGTPGFRTRGIPVIFQVKILKSGFSTGSYSMIN